MKSRSASCLVTAIFAFSVLLAAAAHAVQYLELTARQKERACSPAVITEGGKTVWLAGHAGPEDASGKSLAGDFAAQVCGAFTAIIRTLQRVGGSLDNLVTMTVFIRDVHYGCCV